MNAVADPDAMPINRQSEQALAKTNTFVRSFSSCPLGKFPSPKTIEIERRLREFENPYIYDTKLMRRQQFLRRPEKDDQHCDAILFAHMAT